MKRKVDVGQPPSAVPQAGNQPSLAKLAKSEYHRHLPHLQCEGKTLFVTFVTYKRWILPESVRQVVLKHCLHDNGTKLHVYGVIVMPDHVHMIFIPLNDDNGHPFGLAEIMSGIKGTSAHSINKTLNRRGRVWQDESFDHILRSDESAYNKAQYICENSVRKGLVKEVDDYPWLWREWVEGKEDAAPLPPAP